MIDGHKCSMCKNLLGRKGIQGPYRCKCFPGGIPMGIMLDEYDSRCKRDPGMPAGYSAEYYNKIYSKKPKDTIPTTQDPAADIKTDLRTGHLKDI